MGVEVIHGDMREVLGKMVAEGKTVQSVVTDPPYHLTMAKRLGNSNTTDVEKNFTKTNEGQGVNPFRSQARGFMGKTWDGGDIAFQPGTWRLCFDLLPPVAICWRSLARAPITAWPSRSKKRASRCATRLRICMVVDFLKRTTLRTSLKSFANAKATLYRTTMVNRHPNTTCDLCERPIYRRPTTLAVNAGKFCSRACRNRAHRNTGPRGPNPNLARENNPAWTGGRYIEPDKGYVMIRQPNHPRARKNGYVLEHILVAEKMLGRPLTATEEVHHKDLNRANNEPSNLKIYANHLEHWMDEHYPTVAAARDAASSRKRSKGSRQP